jgi:hypothetical protein
VEFEGAAVHLNLSGLVCHSHAASEQDGFFVGMAFTGLARQDKLMLHYITESRPA